MNSPDEFMPRCPADFLGNAGRIAQVQIAKAARPGRIRLLLYGEPGCGKSAACRVIAEHIAQAHNVSRLSASQLNAETMREWISEGRYRRSEWRVYHLDECDAINPTVEILMLQFLDDLPPLSAVLCTSNLGMGQLTDRFQSRFQCIEVKRPTLPQVEDFLLGHWPELGEKARQIALATNGDVRAALNDAQARLDYMAAVSEGMNA